MANRPMAMTKLNRLEARTRVIKGAGGFFLVTACMALGFVVLATAFPQRRSLLKLEEKLEAARLREQVAFAERENRTMEHRALRDDPAFLEIHARDRLDVYREGERVLKFRKTQ